MRRILIGDLLAAASVIAAAADPAATTTTLILQADAAHRYAKRFGRPHPFWGNGSLMARAMTRPAPQANLSAPQMLDAMARLCAALSARRGLAKNVCPLGSVAPPPHMLIYRQMTEDTHGRDSRETIRS